MKKSPKKKPAKAAAKRRRTARPAHLPEPQGRNSHKKLDDMPALRERVTEWVGETPRPTYDKLHERAAAWLRQFNPVTGKKIDLEDESTSIGRTAIRRWIVDYEAAKEAREDAAAFVRAFNDLANDGEDLEVEEAITLLYNTEILRDLRKSIGQGIDDPTDKKMSTFFKGQSSSAARLSAQLKANRKERKSLLWVIGLAQDLLKGDPDVQRQFIAGVRRKIQELRGQ